MSPITIRHRVPRSDLAFGVLRVEGVEVGAAPTPLSQALDECIARRKAEPLAASEEALRQGCRDVLRNGRYKPTGRGKPASEYLLRAATAEEFPRINGPVDANNLVSLGRLVPISVWDLDLAGTGGFELRLGRPGESYVFNAAGQTLELEDLLCGAGLVGEASRPMVTPIKDGLATKLTPASTRLAGCIYYPVEVGGRAQLAAATEELFRWLSLCGADVRGAWAVLEPGGEVSV